MRKFGLLAALTIVGMLSFSAVALAATPDPLSTDPAIQGSTNNGTGVGTIADPGVTSGQSYRMTPDATFTGGNGGTGFDSPVPSSGSIKYDNPTNAKIHSSYSKTSDACASCHTVHNSVNSGALLQWEDPQTACWACHDGTVASTYNVVTGTHTAGGVTQVNSAGLFGLGTGTAAEAGLSNHGMSPKEPAFVTTAAAPGGAEAAVQDKNGDWTTEFTCVACHDPHGTLGNARILNPNVNNIALQYNADITKVTSAAATLTADAAFKVYSAPTGVNLAKVQINGADVVAPQTATIKDNKVTFGTALTAGDVVTADLTQQGETLAGAADGVNAIFTAKKGNWMSGHGFDPVIYLNGAKQSTGYTVDPLGGRVKFATAPAAGAVVTASYAPGMIVTMDVKNKLTSTETVKYQTGLNEFCGACHTDYNNVNKVPDGKGGFKTGGAYAVATGEYRVAYRHSVGFTRTADSADKTFTNPNSLDALYPGLKFDTSNPKAPGTVAVTVDCLTCHYAHGTSDQFIKDSLTSLGQIGAFMGPNGDGMQNGSPILQTYDSSRTTALKRLPNMGVCQACHNKTGVVATTPAGF